MPNIPRTYVFVETDADDVAMDVCRKSGNDGRKERNLRKKEIKREKEDQNKTKGQEYLMSFRILDIRKRL